MKRCCFRCDTEGCERDSGAEVNFPTARLTAAAEGWLIRDHGAANCPEHHGVVTGGVL